MSLTNRTGGIVVDFGKVITAMVTPFDQQLQIDWKQTAALIDYLIEEQQSDGLVVCGTTGESPTLTDQEKLALFEFAVQHAKGRCRIIAGTGSNDTGHSVHLTEQATKLGVDGILLVAPYYNRPNQEGLYRHFKTIAESTALPVMLYNIPKRSGVTISADTIVRLSRISNVVASKEAHGDLDLITSIIANTSDDFKVYSGDDILTLPLLSIGAYGVVSVVSHVIGKELHRLINHFEQGEVKQAAQLHGKLQPIFNGLFICPSPAPVKYALSLHGINTGGVRLPLVEASEEERKTIKALF
jgi:4-hydroxy-tetrahydrodipicolinate synthase